MYANARMHYKRSPSLIIRHWLGCLVKLLPGDQACPLNTTACKLFFSQQKQGTAAADLELQTYNGVLWLLILARSLSYSFNLHLLGWDWDNLSSERSK